MLPSFLRWSAALFIRQPDLALVFLVCLVHVVETRSPKVAQLQSILITLIPDTAVRHRATKKRVQPPITLGGLILVGSNAIKVYFTMITFLSTCPNYAQSTNASSSSGLLGTH